MRGSLEWFGVFLPSANRLRDRPGIASDTITYRDAGGRVQSSATTRTSAGSTAATIQFRDASGRLTGSAKTTGRASTQRDASGRLTSTSMASGKCQNPVKRPFPPVTSNP